MLRCSYLHQGTHFNLLAYSTVVEPKRKRELLYYTMASVSFAPLPTGSHGFEVEGSDVVKLVLQFLHEQGLSKAAGALQAESGVALNVVDNKESFAAVRT